MDLNGLWLTGDDGLGPSDMDVTPPRPANGYVVVPLAWLERVRREARSVDQLLVLQPCVDSVLVHMFQHGGRDIYRDYLPIRTYTFGCLDTLAASAAS